MKTRKRHQIFSKLLLIGVFFSVFLFIISNISIKTNANVPANRTSSQVISDNGAEKITLTMYNTKLNNRAIVSGVNDYVVNVTVQNSNSASNGTNYQLNYGGGGCVDGSCSNGKWTNTGNIAPGKTGSIQLRISIGGHLRFRLHNMKSGNWNTSPALDTYVSETYPYGNYYADHDGANYWRINVKDFNSYYSEIQGGTSPVNKNIKVGDDISWQGSSFTARTDFYQSDFHLSDAGIAVSTDDKTYTQAWTASNNQSDYGSTVLGIQCRIRNYRTNAATSGTFTPECIGKPPGKAGSKIYVKVDVRKISDPNSFAIDYIISTVTLDRSALTLQKIELKKTYLQRGETFSNENIKDALFTDKSGNIETLNPGTELYVSADNSTFNSNFDMKNTNSVLYNYVGTKKIALKYNWETNGISLPNQDITVNDKNILTTSFISNDKSTIISNSDNCITSGIKLCGKQIDEPVNLNGTYSDNTTFIFKYNAYNDNKTFNASIMANTGIDKNKITLDNKTLSDNEYELNINVPFNAFDLLSENINFNIGISDGEETSTVNSYKFNFDVLEQPTELTTDNIKDNYQIGNSINYGDNKIEYTSPVYPNPSYVSFNDLPKGISGSNFGDYLSLAGTFKETGKYEPTVTISQEVNGITYTKTLELKNITVNYKPCTNGATNPPACDNNKKPVINVTPEIKSIKKSSKYLTITLTKQTNEKITFIYKNKKYLVKTNGKTTIKVKIKTLKKKFKSKLHLSKKAKTYKFKVKLNNTKTVKLRLKR